MLGYEAQPDQPTPVLTDQSDAGEVEDVERHGAHPLDVPRIGVVRDPGRLVGSTEPDQVRPHDPVTGAREAWDNPPIQVGPRRLTMEQQHRVAIGRAVLHPRDAQAPAFVVIDVAMAWWVA